MKFNVKLFTVFLLFNACNAYQSFAETEGYEITVTIKNIQDSVCYLGYPYGDKKYIQDTAKVTNGDTFIFQGEQALKGGIYFIYAPEKVYFDIVVNEPKFTIITDTTDFVGDMKVEGSGENKIFLEFQRFMKSKQQEAKAISDKLKADPNGAEAEKYKAQLKAFDSEVNNFREKLIDENSDTFVAKFIKSTSNIEVPDPPKDENGKETDPNFKYKYYKAHFFDNIDFSDSRMLRTPIFHSKIMEYLDNLTVKQPDSIAASAHYIIDKSMANDDVFRYCLVTITNKYETSNIMGMDAVFVDLAKNYYLKGDAYWADSTLLNKIGKRVKELEPNLLGKKAPEMVLLDTLMKPVALNTIKADYLVLFFYDPDCGHCQKKTPILNKLYTNSLKNKGVKIVGACIATDIDKWKKFIKKDQLDWINLADPYYRSNFRADYNVSSTPKIYILDSKKNIIAKELDVDQIEGFIDKQIEFHQKQQNPG